MTRQGTDEWLEQLAREERDAAGVAKAVDRNAGKIPAHAGFYWNAFAALSGDRQVVSETVALPTPPGAPPVMFNQLRERRIPFTAINAYARRHRITGERFDQFARLIQAMDDEFLKVMAELRANAARGIGQSDGD